MAKYILKRLGMAVLTILVIIIILFCLLKLMPGSPFNNERLTDAQRAVLEAKYGLDKPLLQQMVIYIKNVLTGDFGVSYSIQTNYPVNKMIGNKLLVSFRLGFFAAIVTCILALLAWHFAGWQKTEAERQDMAIVMRPVSSVKSSPSADSAKDLFILHEGTRVRILDNVSGFSNIELADGRQGWISARDIEVI